MARRPAGNSAGYIRGMKAALRLAIFTLIAVLLIGASFAADVTGKWSGKFNADKQQADSNPRMARMMEAMAKASFQLTLNKNKTYTMIVKGGPRGDMTRKGTWSEKGNEITLTPEKPKANPQAAQGGQGGGRGFGGAGMRGPREQVLTLSKDGKTLTGKNRAGTLVYTKS